MAKKYKFPKTIKSKKTKTKRAIRKTKIPKGK